MASPLESDASDRRKIYQVGELTHRIKAILEDEVGIVWLEGEVSNLSRPASGHLYFTLKDEVAQIKAVLFRGNQAGLRVEIKDGLKIRVQGNITVYEKSGQYQMLVRRVELAGKGSLQEQFELLKEKLAREGLFESARKKPLPLLPRRIGIVTSPSGAAIRDMLNILGRRFPNLHIQIAPVRVQGEGAAKEIADAIDFLNARGGYDVLIVGRGGGSLEDLWSFNEEVVARAIVRSRIPVISAVGHEVDFTISDFVADLRAPTPSAAAELVVQPKAAFEEQLSALSRHLASALQTRVLELHNRLTRAGGSYVFKEPANLLLRHRQRLELMRKSLKTELQNTVTERHQRVDEAGMRMTHAIQMLSGKSGERVKRLAAQLQALSPLAVLDRGFSITRKAGGGVVKSFADLKKGDEIETLLARGSIVSEVSKTSKERDHGRQGS